MSPAEVVRRMILEPLPEWKVLLACLGSRLTQMRLLIEAPEVKEVSWGNPWVEAQYHVYLEAASARQGGEDWFTKFQSPPLPEGAPRTPEATKTAMESAIRQFDTELFQKLTRGLAYLKRGDKADVLIPSSIPEEERRAPETLFDPFTVCLGRWSEDDEEARQGDELPFRNFQHFPDFRVVDDAGDAFEVTLALVVHPLVIEVDEQDPDERILRAYYPVVSGLRFWGADVNPETWAAERRDKFWDAISEGVHAVLWATPETAATFPLSLPLPLPALVEDIPRDVETGPVRTFPMALPTHALMSNEAAEILQHVHRVRLPSKWSTLPRWEKLVRDYIEELRANEEEWERAFQDIRKLTGDKEEHGPLLKCRHKPGGEEEIFLTKEGNRLLRERHGLWRGFIEIKGIGQEYLVRIFQTPAGGLLEVGLSWAGLAGPLVDEWRKKRLQQVEEQKRDLQSPLLFEDLNAEERRRVDRLVEQAHLWIDGRRVMDMVLAQVSAQQRNPVEIPAEAFRVLLWPGEARARTWPTQWKRKVDEILSALSAMRFYYRTHGAPESAEGQGYFIGEWDYIRRGKGRHGEGVYVLDVQPGFLGCLRLFESGKTRLRSGREALYLDFGKELSKDEKGKLRGEGGYLTFDAGRAFYNAAAGLTATQDNLVKWIEYALTKKRDHARRENKGRKVRPNAPDANSPRVYDHAFCPLLPEGRGYYGTLGHFKKNPEAGFTLGGTESRPARHTAGILAEIGYRLPPGPWCIQKDEVLKSALGDLKAVVMEYFGGIVAGRLGDEWIPLEQFRDLDEKELCHKLKVLCFLPEDYTSKRRAKFEQTTGYRVTENQQEAERAAWEIMDEDGEEEEESEALNLAVSAGYTESREEASIPEIPDAIPSVRNAFRGLPLRERLREVMRRRQISGAALAALFGVTKMSVSRWLTGKKPIADDAVPLLLRWIETGAAPTAEELQARRNRTGA